MGVTIKQCNRPPLLWEDAMEGYRSVRQLARERDHYLRMEKRMAKRGKKYLAVAQVT